MKRLHFGKICIEVPEGFNELTGSQLVKLMKVMQQREDPLQARIEALKVMCSKGAVRFYMLPSEAVLAFSEQIDWAFQENTLTKQLIPSYDGYHGVTDELGTLRMKEFHFTEQYYKQFIEEKTDEMLLNKLIAVLYRPKAATPKDGDEREPFHSHLIEEHAKRIGQWPLAVRLAILFFYDGCRQYLIGLYDEVFGGGGDGEESPYGMYALMMELAGEKLGTVEQVENMYVHNALASLEIMIQKAEAMNRAQNTSS